MMNVGNHSAELSVAFWRTVLATNLLNAGYVPVTNELIAYIMNSYIYALITNIPFQFMCVDPMKVNTYIYVFCKKKIKFEILVFHETVNTF